jgi:hypothetical protein
MRASALRVTSSSIGGASTTTRPRQAGEGSAVETAAGSASAIAVSSAIPIIDNRREYAKRPSVWMRYAERFPRCRSYLSRWSLSRQRSLLPSPIPLFMMKMDGPFANLADAAAGWDMTVSFSRDGTLVHAGRDGGLDAERLYRVTFP